MGLSSARCLKMSPQLYLITSTGLTFLKTKQWHHLHPIDLQWNKDVLFANMLLGNCAPMVICGYTYKKILPGSNVGPALLSLPRMRLLLTETLLVDCLPSYCTDISIKDSYYALNEGCCSDNVLDIRESLFLSSVSTFQLSGGHKQGILLSLFGFVFTVTFATDFRVTRRLHRFKLRPIVSEWFAFVEESDSLFYFCH